MAVLGWNNIYRGVREQIEQSRISYERQIKEVCESKVSMMLALNDAMDAMRENLRPKKK